MKICNDTRCVRRGIMQPLSSFSKDKTNADGHRAQCKGCQKRDYDERKKELPWRASPDAKLGIMIYLGGTR